MANNNITNNNITNNNIKNEIEETNTITMNLENLQQQYSNLLISYQQAVANYLNYLSQMNSTTEENLIELPGKAYNGTGSAGASQATNLQDCIASCSNSSNCTGATFVSNQCLLRTGDSPIISSSENSYAIIPKSKKLLLTMENINEKLINVNQNITRVMNKANPLYNSQVEQRFEQQQNLIQNYWKLNEEREKILSLLKEYETLDNTSINDKIKITQNYYTYIFLLILAVASIFILYKLSYLGSSTAIMTPTVQYGGDLGINAYFIVFIIVIIILFIGYFTK